MRPKKVKVQDLIPTLSPSARLTESVMMACRTVTGPIRRTWNCLDAGMCEYNQPGFELSLAFKASRPKRA
jgi:hypothetical protein